METILIEIEQLNIGMTSLLRGKKIFKKEDLNAIIQKIMEKI